MVLVILAVVLVVLGVALVVLELSPPDSSFTETSEADADGLDAP